jgi:hypothetical protein
MRNSLIPYNLTTFAFSAFRLQFHEPFAMPFVYSIETLPETLSFPSDSTGDLSSPLLSYANGGNYKPYGHRQLDLYHGKVMVAKMCNIACFPMPSDGL